MTITEGASHFRKQNEFKRRFVRLGGYVHPCGATHCVR